jgi:integrase/uncharacterized coiled-coil protein SlyX
METEFTTQEFLDSMSNPFTRKQYRLGINKFSKWFGEPPEEILRIRKEDLTQNPDENLVDYRNRASRFEKQIELFHSHLLSQGYSINTARTNTIGIIQLFSYYRMPIILRNSQRKISRTVKTTRSFPLTIEHVRAMFQVGDLRERVILSTATDLGLRISDFSELKKADIPPLNQETPIQIEIMTNKENVLASGFLSRETVELLKIYVPTLDKAGNPYLFPSNHEDHISPEWINLLLQRLSVKAGIQLNGKTLTFHCFRKMFLSACINSGIGLTAGKKLCGKSIPQSDDTYLTTVNLREKFILLKNFLTIQKQSSQSDDTIESLKSTIADMQIDLHRQNSVIETITQKLVDVQPLIELTNAHDKDFVNLKKFVDLVKSADATDITSKILDLVTREISKNAESKGITPFEEVLETVKERLYSIKGEPN